MTILNLIGGGLLLCVGVSLVARSILLSGRAMGWPDAPRWLRWVFECGGCLIAGYGGVVVTGRDTASWGQVMTYLVFAVINISLLINLARQRVPRPHTKEA